MKKHKQNSNQHKDLGLKKGINDIIKERDIIFTYFR